MSDGQPMPRYNLLNTVGSPDSATGVIDTMRGSFQRDAYRAVAAPSLRGSWDARGAWSSRGLARADRWRCRSCESIRSRRTGTAVTSTRA